MATLIESMIQTASRQLQPVTDKMYDRKYPLLDNLLNKLEEASGTKREKLVYGAGIFLFVYFLVGSLVQILCNLVGFIYPAWRSIHAVRSPQKDDDTKWLIYWIVFASFSVVDFSVFSSIPFYWLAKVVFLMYLYLPTFKGANVVYERYIDPACNVVESYFTPKEKLN